MRRAPEIVVSMRRSAPPMGSLGMGHRVQVYWPSEDAWYCGRVAEHDPERGYRVEYDDGDTEWLESLDDPTLVRPLEEEEEEQVERPREGSDRDGEGEGAVEDEGLELHPEELRVYDDDHHHYDDDDDEEEEDRGMSKEYGLHGSMDEDGGGGHHRGHPPPTTEDTFSPLPSPDVARLYKAEVGSRPFHSSCGGGGGASLAVPERLAEADLGHTFDELRHEWTGQPTSTLDDIDALIEQRQKQDKCETPEDEDEEEDQWAHQSEGEVQEEDEEGEEAAVVEGHIGPAHLLPTTEPCFVRVLYVESPGANLLFACKTTIHQTEHCPSRGAAWEWDEGAFRFEVLPPCPGEPVEGEVVMAVSQARGGGTTTTFLGQVVIDLASAAEPGAEKVVEGDFPLRTRKGEVLPGGPTLHVTLKVNLPKPCRPGSSLHHRAENQQTRRPLQPAEPSESKHRARTVSAVSKRPTPAPRKSHHAIHRQKMEERLAKENKLYQERIRKIKPAQAKRRPRTASGSVAQASSYGPRSRAETKDGRLSIQIPGDGSAAEEAPPAQQAADGEEALSDRIRVLQQEVAALKDAIKVGGAKVLRADTQRRNQLRAIRAIGPAANNIPLPSPSPLGPASAPAPVPSWVPSPLLTEEALQTLKEAGNPLVEVYRDRLARRTALTSKIDSFRRECERTAGKAAKLQEQIDKAERSRRSYHRQDDARGGRKGAVVNKAGAGGVGGAASSAAAREEKLQAEEMDLRVEIDALKSAKGTNLYNGDLQHELHVIQDHIQQKQTSIGEVKARLQTCKYDRDTAKAKYLAIVTDQVHHKLTKSVAALQMATVVASKGRQWTEFITQAALVGAKAQVTRMGLASETRTAP